MVDAVAQRRLRPPSARPQEPVPTPITQPTASPTGRGVCQRLAGMPRVQRTLPGQVQTLIAGLHDRQIHVLRLVGAEVCSLDQMSSG